jgi:hypothetical protein
MSGTIEGCSERTEESQRAGNVSAEFPVDGNKTNALAGSTDWTPQQVVRQLDLGSPKEGETSIPTQHAARRSARRVMNKLSTARKGRLSTIEDTVVYKTTKADKKRESSNSGSQSSDTHQDDSEPTESSDSDSGSEDLEMPGKGAESQFIRMLQDWGGSSSALTVLMRMQTRQQWMLTPIQWF